MAFVSEAPEWAAMDAGAQKRFFSEYGYLIVEEAFSPCGAGQPALLTGRGEVC